MCGSRPKVSTPPAPKPAPMNASGVSGDEADLTVKKKKKGTMTTGTKGYRNSTATTNTSLNVGGAQATSSGLNISK